MKIIFACKIWFTILAAVRSQISTSLYTSLEVGSDSLASLPSRDSLVTEDLVTCGLSCSSQDCPGFSYREDSKLCTRLKVAGPVSPPSNLLISQVVFPVISSLCLPPLQ